ncbi:MAG: hypothetical protein KJ052_14640, partial [Candidatus Hydrogenedentes bacterium]|nr:hypothetical protein [Candidatus Hydrogenedentota bacterium]
MNESQNNFSDAAGSGKPDKAELPDPDQIPHLIRLLDDESEAVRAEVRARLLEYGEVLEDAVEALGSHMMPL